MSVHEVYPSIFQFDLNIVDLTVITITDTNKRPFKANLVDLELVQSALSSAVGILQFFRSLILLLPY